MAEPEKKVAEMNLGEILSGIGSGKLDASSINVRRKVTLVKRDMTGPKPVVVETIVRED